MKAHSMIAKLMGAALATTMAAGGTVALAAENDSQIQLNSTNRIKVSSSYSDFSTDFEFTPSHTGTYHFESSNIVVSGNGSIDPTLTIFEASDYQNIVATLDNSDTINFNGEVELIEGHTYIFSIAQKNAYFNRASGSFDFTFTESRTADVMPEDFTDGEIIFPTEEGFTIAGCMFNVINTDGSDNYINIERLYCTPGLSNVSVDEVDGYRIHMGKRYVAVRVSIVDGMVYLDPITANQLPSEEDEDEDEMLPEDETPFDDEDETPSDDDDEIPFDDEDEIPSDDEDEIPSDDETPSDDDTECPIDEDVAPDFGLTMISFDDTDPDIEPVVEDTTVVIVDTTAAPVSENTVVQQPAASVSQISTPVVSRSLTQIFVDRLYENTLGRSSDIDDSTTMVEMLNNNVITATDLVKMFLDSNEFTNRNLDNEDFVKTLYSVFCNRSVSADEISNWTEALNNGASRDEVINAFTGSADWSSTCAQFAVNS